jgi:flagellar basal-body rod modification protein FlgD
MSAIPATTAADAARQSGSNNVANDKATLDKDGFLKMLVAQMTQQDPTSPMDAAQQTQQMASFTMVEQITNMASENAKTAAVAMIGHKITYVDPADKTKTQTKSGTVESVSMGRDGAYTLTVSGTSGVDPTSITQVA